MEFSLNPGNWRSAATGTMSCSHQLLHFHEPLHSDGHNDDRMLPTLLFLVPAANHHLDICAFPLFSLCSIITQLILFSHAVSSLAGASRGFLMAQMFDCFWSWSSKDYLLHLSGSSRNHLDSSRFFSAAQIFRFVV